MEAGVTIHNGSKREDSTFLFLNMESIRLKFVSHTLSSNEDARSHAHTHDCHTLFTFQMERMSLVGSLRQSVLDRTLDGTYLLTPLSNLPFAQSHFCIGDISGVHSFYVDGSPEMCEELFLRRERERWEVKRGEGEGEGKVVFHASVELPYRDLLNEGKAATLTYIHTHTSRLLSLSSEEVCE